jgi:DNA-binding protein HU-beta
LLNKADLIDSVAAAVQCTKKDAGQAVDAIFAAIRDSLRQGQDVTIVGFGSFEVRARAARKGRNPQTGKAIQIRGRKVPAFRAGKPLRDAVAG